MVVTYVKTNYKCQEEPLKHAPGDSDVITLPRAPMIPRKNGGHIAKG